MRSILIVEDNPVNQLLMRKKLEQAGYPLTLLAKNGQEAVALGLKEDPGLILMDIQLPDMNGNDVIRTLRQKGYAGPIVAVSADSAQEDLDRSSAAGANGYITKPIDFAALFAKIKDWLPAGAGGKETGGGQAGPPQARIDPSLSAATRKVFIDDAKEKLQIIAAALAHAEEEGQMERIKAIAHEYKGNAGYFGLRELERIARELDAGFRNDEASERLKELTGRLTAEIEGILRHEDA